MGFSDFRHLFRRAFGNNIAAAIAAFRAKIDNPIGGFDHIHIMFDHNDTITLLDEFLQNLQQLGNIMEMQTGCWFIQNVNRAARCTAR